MLFLIVFFFFLVYFGTLAIRTFWLILGVLTFATFVEFVKGIFLFSTLKICLCLAFNESQSTYAYRHYKKACNLTHYHKYINVFSYNNLTYSVSVEPLQLGTIFHLFGLRCISVNYATLIRNQKNPRVNEFLMSELNQMF